MKPVFAVVGISRRDVQSRRCQGGLVPLGDRWQLRGGAVHFWRGWVSVGLPLGRRPAGKVLRLGGNSQFGV